MDEVYSFPVGAVYQLTGASLLASCYAIMGISQTGQMVYVALFPWMAWAVLSYGFFFLFVRKPRTYPSLALAVVLSFGIGCACVLPFSVLPGLVGLLLSLPLLAISCGQGVVLALHPTTRQRCVHYVELSVVGAGLFLLFQAGGSMLPDVYYPVLLAVVGLNILAAIRVRTSGGQSGAFGGTRTALILAGITVAIFVLLMLFGSLGGASLRDGIFSVFGLIGAGFSAIGRLIWAFFEWFCSLFPDPEPMPIEEPKYEGFTIEEIEEMRENAVALPPWLLPAIVCVLAVVLCGVFLWRCRKTRTRAMTAPARSTGKVRSIGLLATLSRLFGAIRGWFSYQYHVFRHRHDACGMMIRIERWGRLHRQAKQPGETYRGYLARLEGLPPEAGPLLLQLAGALDARYYGAGDVPFSPAQAAALSALLHQHSR